MSIMQYSLSTSSSETWTDFNEYVKKLSTCPFIKHFLRAGVQLGVISNASTKAAAFHIDAKLCARKQTRALWALQLCHRLYFNLNSFFYLELVQYNLWHDLGECKGYFVNPMAIPLNSLSLPIRRVLHDIIAGLAVRGPQSPRCRGVTRGARGGAWGRREPALLVVKTAEKVIE